MVMTIVAAVIGLVLGTGVILKNLLKSNIRLAIKIKYQWMRLLRKHD